MTFEAKARELIKRVPFGRVASYGQIAGMAGSPRAARAVGWIFRRNVIQLPWHRIINSSGRISIINIDVPASQQAAMLEEEGIAIIKKNGQLWIKDKELFWHG